MSAIPAIELRKADIAQDPAARAVLCDVSWGVQPGDFWVITGAHGSGKSILLETMAGVRPCASGELCWFGQPVTTQSLSSSNSTALRRRVGMVFEGGGRVFGDLSVAGNLALPISYHEGVAIEDAMQRTTPLREALDIERMAGVSAGRIGRAWMQRVALGRALALGPEVLLLDNPVGGLDARNTVWWRTFLQALSKGHPAVGGRPITLVVSTDDARLWDGDGHRFGEVRDRRWVPLTSAAGTGD
ncbi:MAG: ATP-binding cassette domain-containing protein [Verrucomicrobiae bacterium]|nr:ATP-binding cassette domain-containing protein [Verrucomicrobiae bacterium]